MPATLLGSDALAAMLAGRGSVTIANRCTDDDDTRILAVAAVRHDASGKVAAECAYELDLAPGESEILEPLDAAAATPQAIEMLLRVFSVTVGTIADVYVSAEASESGSSGAWEAGLRDTHGPPEAGEVEVPNVPGIRAYLREV